MKQLFFAAFLCLFAAMITRQVYGEGTQGLMPNNTNGTGLIVSTTSSFPLGNVGSYLSCPVDNRIYFNIKDYTKENLYYGFRWNLLGLSGTVTSYNDVYMKIYDPTGSLVSTIRLPVSGAGFMTSYARAVNGPNIGTATTGYDPLEFIPLKNGDYWVEFYRSSNGGTSAISGGQSMLAPLFDMTVAQTNNVRFPGRVHCNKWAFSVYDPSTYYQSATLSSQAPFYAYSADSVVTKVAFRTGFLPLAFVIAVNNYGVVNTGNWIQDRRSVNSTSLPALLNGYNVFLNPPDTTLYPPCPAPVAPSLVSLIIAGCHPGPYAIRFNAPQRGDYYILLDLNGVSGYQAGSADRFFEAINQLPGVSSIAWDGLDGLGVPVPQNTPFPITFSFRKGRINVPLYDVELNINGLEVSAISPVYQPNARLYWNDALLSNIGSTCGTSGDNNNNVSGIGYNNEIVGQVSPGHAWNGNGNSGFAIPAPAISNNNTDTRQCNDFGNARLINTWAWGIELTRSETLTLGCITVSGTVWDDADNSAAGTFINIKTGSEAGTNAGNNLYAILVDPVTNNVLSSAPVNADGTYTINGCPINVANIPVIISTTPGIQWSPAPASAVPADWINTSPIQKSFSTGVVNITGIDFGIEQLPNSNSQNYTIARPAVNSYLTLNGDGTVSYPGPLSGSDPEDGIMGSAKKVVITQVPANAVLYYNGNILTSNSVITNYDPSLLRIRFTVPGIINTSFQYAFVDAAGKQDPSPANYVINFAFVLTSDLIGFSAGKLNQHIILKWTMSRESAQTTYTIERSRDGRYFERLGMVMGGDAVHHEFRDDHPLRNVSAYYRLKLDNGATISYSRTVELYYTGSAVAEITPTSFSDVIKVRLHVAGPGNVSLRLIGLNGVVYKELNVACNKGENNYQLKNLTLLPSSFYLLQVALPDQLLIYRLSKK